MSWDIFVQDLPQGIRSVDELPSDFRPRPIGKRVDIIAAIKEIIPDADFSNPCWGMIEGADYSIEVNLGQQEILDGFALHVRGGSEEVSKVVLKLLRHLGLCGIDPSAYEILTPKSLSAPGFRRWKDFRDRVIGQGDDGAGGGT